MTPILTGDRLVANFVPVSQFEYDETEYACGYFGGSELRSATPPPIPPTDSSETVDNWADAQYKAVYGSFGVTQTGGISIDELHAVLHNGGLHYWDIAAIAPGSPQAGDIAHIKAALVAGYPVIATVIEASVRDVTGDIPVGNPYEWRPVCNQSSCPTHVLIYGGIAPDGNLLAIDYANVVGPLQGANTVRPWPRIYDIATINNTFASVVQLVGPDTANPWLRPIPSGDPTSWPAEYSAQNFASGEDVSVQITDPAIAQYFTIVNGNCLQRKDTGVTMGSGITAFYLKYGGPGVLRLPETSEIAVDAQQYPGVVYVVMEGGIIVWDPAPRKLDNPPTTEGAYLMKTDSGLGQQLIAGALAQKEQTLQAALQTIAMAAQQALGV